MRQIVRRDPFQTMRQMMDRVFDDSLFRPLQRTHVWGEGTLAVDIAESEKDVIVRASLPGFKRDDIDVQLRNGVLAIKAERSQDEETGTEKFYRRERRSGSLSRRVALPSILHDAEVQGELEDGVLTLRIPIPERAQPKQIEIKAA